MPEPNDEVIIRKYCDVLSAPSKSVIRHESELPFPKAAIKGALKRDILRTSDPRELDLLKSVYASLADFQNMTAEEKEAVAFMSNLPDTTGFGTEQLRELAQRMASIGDSHQVVMDRYKVELDAVSNDLKSLAAERDQAKAQAHLVANRADALSVQPEPRYAAATAFLAISVLTLPLILLNGFGGVVGGVWLAVLREWTPLLRGILASLFGPLAISVVLMPGAFLFATPAAMLMQKGRLVLASPFILLAQTYTHLIVAAWAIFVFFLIGPWINSDNLWPMLLWMYSATMSPWSYFAAKNQGGNDSEVLILLFTGVALLATAFVMFFLFWPPGGCAAVFAGVLLLSILVNTAAAVRAARAVTR